MRTRTAPATPPAIPSRYHHLDALRASAMLLGVVFHAFLSFVFLPIWPAQDIHQEPFYDVAQHVVHGFRMPLFFLVSGYFTALLWKRRGLRALAIHRAKRILLPLVASWFVCVPLFISVGIWGTIQKRNQQEQSSKVAADLIAATKAGQLDRMQTFLEEGAEIDRRDELQLTALAWCAITGKSEEARLLLDHGADPDVRDGEKGTPLHSAAFFGHPEVAKLLVERGADLDAANKRLQTPLYLAINDGEAVETVGSWLGLRIDRKRTAKGRAETAKYLEELGASKEGEGWTLVDFWKLGATKIPVLFHLWFLYYLIWLVLFFMLAVLVLRRTSIRPWKHLNVSGPLPLLLLIPLTFGTQVFMTQSFGADTAGGPLPWPPKLAYYMLFFGFGAICYGRTGFEQRAGTSWPLYFLLSAGTLCAGLHFYKERPEIFTRSQLLMSLCIAAYAWFMIYGCLGLFRQLFSRPSPTMRYLSDASYWMYLAHLPLVMAVQIAVMNIDLPSPVKLLIICTITFGVLLLSYHYLVRYTWIGTMLNGKKYRVPPLPPNSPPG